MHKLNNSQQKNKNFDVKQVIIDETYRTFDEEKKFVIGPGATLDYPSGTDHPILTIYDNKNTYATMNSVHFSDVLYHIETLELFFLNGTILNNNKEVAFQVYLEKFFDEKSIFIKNAMISNIFDIFDYVLYKYDDQEMKKNKICAFLKILYNMKELTDENKNSVINMYNEIYIMIKSDQSKSFYYDIIKTTQNYNLSRSFLHQIIQQKSKNLLNIIHKIKSDIILLQETDEFQENSINKNKPTNFKLHNNSYNYPSQPYTKDKLEDCNTRQPYTKDKLEDCNTRYIVGNNLKKSIENNPIDVFNEIKNKCKGKAFLSDDKVYHFVPECRIVYNNTKFDAYTSIYVATNQLPQYDNNCSFSFGLLKHKTDNIFVLAISVKYRNTIRGDLYKYMSSTNKNNIVFDLLKKFNYKLFYTDNQNASLHVLIGGDFNNEYLKKREESRKPTHTNDPSNIYTIFYKNVKDILEEKNIVECDEYLNSDQAKVIFNDHTPKPISNKTHVSSEYVKTPTPTSKQLSNENIRARFERIYDAAKKRTALNKTGGAKEHSEFENKKINDSSVMKIGLFKLTKKETPSINGGYYERYTESKMEYLLLKKLLEPNNH